MTMVGTDMASRHYPARLEAGPMLQGSAEWQLEVGCWQPKLVKQNISRHRGGQEDHKVGSVAAWAV